MNSISIPDNFMGLCTGRACPSYNGIVSMQKCIVNCGVVHQAIKTNMCPKRRQTTLKEW